MDILQSIGNTSLVQLRKVVPANAEIFAKLEWENPTGSMKDRMAQAVISRAEADGRLKPGDRILSAATTGSAKSRNRLERKCAMRRQQILIALALMFGLGVGFVAGRSTQGQASPSNDTPAFVQAVGQAGTSALTLELLRGGEPGKVERLHSALLRSSLEAADRLQSAPLVPEAPLPNLVEAAARTAAFCKADPEFAEMAGTAAEVRDRMQALSDDAL